MEHKNCRKEMSVKVGIFSALLLMAAQTPLYAETNNSSEETFPKGTYIGVSIGLVGDQDGDVSQRVKGPGSFDLANGSWWRQDSLDAINAALDSTSGQDGIKGKLSIGHIFRINNFVVSPEASVTRFFNSEISTTTGDIEYPCCAGSTVKITQVIKPKFNLDGTVRIGYPIKKFMPYVAGGPSLSIANITNSFSDSFGLSAEKKNNGYASWGYTLGGGIEYALNKNTSIKLEYTYSQYSLPESSASGYAASGERIHADKATYRGNYYQGVLWLGANFRL